MATEIVHDAAEAERKRVFKFTIDKVPFELHRPDPSARDLLTLAGKLPVEQYGLYLKQKGSQPQRIQLDESVDLSAPGVEQFVTLPLDQTEG